MNNEGKRLTSRVEDYLRALYQIVERKGYARAKDIAKELGVSLPSVTEMMKKLNEMGLVLYERYGGIVLTAKGREVAEAIAKRHEAFKKFLKLILLPEEIVARDAHILEHQLHPRTVLQIARFVEFLTNPSNEGLVRECLEAFKKYCENEERSARRTASFQ